MKDLTPADLALEIEAAWESRDSLNPDFHGPARTAVEEALTLLDSGRARVAEKVDGAWVAYGWERPGR
jgi:2,3,4,5-tetrahydropyridine-2-carboxylate N-succinyltransferase